MLAFAVLAIARHRANAAAEQTPARGALCVLQLRRIHLGGRRVPGGEPVEKSDAEIRTSGLMSGGGKQGNATAPVLDPISRRT
jgi:hypothetical protein